MSNNPMSECLYQGIKRFDKMRTIKVSSNPPIELSKIICGTGQFGSGISDQEAFSILDAYYEAGGRTIDTAKVYGTWAKDGGHHSERVVGEWLLKRQLQNKMQIITKGAHPDINHMDVPRVDVKSIKEDIDSSLMRLKIERIDIYMLHRDDPNADVSELMDCLHELVMNGKAGAISASNWTTRRINEANEYAVKKGITPFTSSEICKNLGVLNSGSMGMDIPDVIEEDMLYYQKNNIPILAWGCLAGGYFIKSVNGIPETIRPQFIKQYKNEITDKRVENLKKVMKDSQLSAEELCIAYLTSHPIPMAAITGPTNAEQIKASLSAAGLVLPIEMIKDLEQL